MELIYQDRQLCVAVKPPRVLSTDEPGGMPDLVREALGDPDACVRTVHRLDRVVSGLMVLARTARAAADLSQQIREGTFDKYYLAVVHGTVDQESGTFTDLLLRDKAQRKTFVVTEPGKGVQTATLEYQILDRQQGCSLVRIHLLTGRTHQIRAQFSARGLPLVGDRKYSTLEDGCEIALWSAELRFCHPKTGEPMTFQCPPPQETPWTWFQK